MAYSLKFLPQRDGVVITKSDYPVDGVGDQQRFPHGALSLRYSTTSDAPSGQVEVVRISDDAAVGVFNATTGSVDGVDHDGDISVLLLAAMTAINGKGYELESGGTGIAVTEYSSTFDCRGLKDVVAYVTVNDIDEDVTLAVQTSLTGEDGTWVGGSSYVKDQPVASVTFPAAPFVRLFFASRAAIGTPTIDVTYYGVKA